MQTSNRGSVEQLKACVAEVHNSPEFSPIAAHIPANPTDLTLQQLSDTSLATPEEVQAIFAVHPQLQACRKAFVSGLAQSEPSLVPILLASFNSNEDDLIALTEQKMTWGDYARRSRDRWAETVAALQAEDRRVVSGLKQEHQAEVEQRQRAGEAISRWAQTQQLINAANRPVFTNCNGFGNSFNCITR